MRRRGPSPRSHFASNISEMAWSRRMLVYRSGRTAPTPKPAIGRRIAAARMPVEEPSVESPAERLRLRRFVPLVAVAVAAILVMAMGWHRELSLENVVRYRDQLDAFV